MSSPKKIYKKKLYFSKPFKKILFSFFLSSVLSPSIPKIALLWFQLEIWLQKRKFVKDLGSDSTPSGTKCTKLEIYIQIFWIHFANINIKLSRINIKKNIFNEHRIEFNTLTTTYYVLFFNIEPIFIYSFMWKARPRLYKYD